MKVAFEAIAGQRSVTELSANQEVCAKQIHEGKKQLLTGAPELFTDNRPFESPPLLPNTTTKPSDLTPISYKAGAGETVKSVDSLGDSFF